MCRCCWGRGVILRIEGRRVGCLGAKKSMGIFRTGIRYLMEWRKCCHDEERERETGTVRAIVGTRLEVSRSGRWPLPIPPCRSQVVSNEDEGVERSCRVRARVAWR